MKKLLSNDEIDTLLRNFKAVFQFYVHVSSWRAESENDIHLDDESRERLKELKDTLTEKLKIELSSASFEESKDSEESENSEESNVRNHKIIEILNAFLSKHWCILHQTVPAIFKDEQFDEQFPVIKVKTGFSTTSSKEKADKGAEAAAATSPTEKFDTFIHLLKKYGCTNLSELVESHKEHRNLPDLFKSKCSQLSDTTLNDIVKQLTRISIKPTTELDKQDDAALNEKENKIHIENIYRVFEFFSKYDDNIIIVVANIFRKLDQAGLNQDKIAKILDYYLLDSSNHNEEILALDQILYLLEDEPTLIQDKIFGPQSSFRQ